MSEPVVSANDAGLDSEVDVQGLFRPGVSPSDWVRGLRSLVTALHNPLHDVATATAGGAEAVAERTGQILTQTVDQLPIRGADELRRQHGSEPRRVAQGVIDDAAELARWLWAATNAVPAPELVLHTAKVVLHSAIEIRMIGELHEAVRDPNLGNRPTPLGTAVAVWAGDAIAARAGSMPSPATVAIHLRREFDELRGKDGRLKGVINRGKEGGEIIRRRGQVIHSNLQA